MERTGVAAKKTAAKGTTPTAARDGMAYPAALSGHSTLHAADLLMLQRSIGNHALQRLLAANPSLSISSAGAAVVQRLPSEFSFKATSDTDIDVFYQNKTLSEPRQAGYLTISVAPIAKVSGEFLEFLDTFKWFKRSECTGVLQIGNFYPNEKLGGERAGLGGGTAAMHYLATLAKKRGCNVMLITLAEGGAAFYKKMSFQPSPVYDITIMASTTADVLSETSARWK